MEAEDFHDLEFEPHPELMAGAVGPLLLVVLPSSVSIVAAIAAIFWFLR